MRHALGAVPCHTRDPLGEPTGQSKARSLLERLRDREDQILRFAADLTVPLTNNGSERGLRPVKT